MSTMAISRHRLLTELAAIHKRHPAMRLLSLETGRAILEGTVTIDEAQHYVRLTFPPGYPSIPPDLREIEAPGGGVCIRAEAFHRFEDGSLCLFPHGNDQQGWHPNRLAVEALDKFSELVAADRARAEKRGGLLFREPRAVYVSAGIATLLRWPDGHGMLSFRLAANGAGDLFADSVDVAGERLANADALGPKWSALLPQMLQVPWTQLPLHGQPWEQIAANRDTLNTALQEELSPIVFNQLCDQEWLVVVRAEEKHLVDSRKIDAVLLHRSSTHPQALYIAPLNIAHPQEQLFHRIDGVLPKRERLTKLRVVLIGLGSLGGAIALALGRAGIGRFVLIDPDRLSVDNICRHVGTIHEIGQYKVDVIKHMLTAINPEVEVTAIPKWLAWDLPSFGAGVELERMLTETHRTIIITTCAAHPTERLLNALAVAHKQTVIYATALGSAEHGRIFRVIPQTTPCYECILNAQDTNPARFPRFIHDAAQGEPIPYLQPELPGLGIDITQIAMIAARFTLQTLARLEKIDLGLADESGHHLIWTNRGGWLFDRPLQLIVQHIERSPTCATCGDHCTDTTLTEVNEKVLQDLIATLSMPTR
ncbi:MAG: hypothetical protein Tsb0020_13290 [Haliangiales bacterium]